MAGVLDRLSCALVAAAVFGCTPTTVVRVIDGREIAGRFVSERAYALYARGAEAEARGDLPGARIEYLAAAEQDEGSADVWTRVAAVSCKLGRDDDARDAFTKAADHAPDYEPLYRERALCTLGRAHLTEAEARGAFEDATRSLALDPDSEDAALLYARAAEAAGDTGKAERALRELVVRSPGRSAGWRALRDFAARRGDTPAVARAAIALEALEDAGPASAGGATSAGSGPPTAGGPAAPTGGANNPAPPASSVPAPSNTAPSSTAPSSTAPGNTASSNTAPSNTAPSSFGARAVGTLEDVDAAIARGSIEEARTAAKHARVQPAELAARAAALGQARLAKTQAELVFKAEPTNATAALALAVASDLLHDDAGVATALADPGALTTTPSPLARLLFTELLQRRTDRDAALAYAGPIGAPSPDADALLRSVTERVRAGLRK